RVRFSLRRPHPGKFACQLRRPDPRGPRRPSGSAGRRARASVARRDRPAPCRGGGRVVHTLLGLSSLLLVVLVGYLALAILRRLGGWARRRDLQLLVLAAPLVSLGLALGGLHHFAGRVCFLGAPPWDYAVAAALPFAMGAVAIGGLGLGMVRLALMARVVKRTGVAAGVELQGLAAGLAEQLGTARPRVRLCAYHRPLALTSGLWRPTLLVSTW